MASWFYLTLWRTPPPEFTQTIKAALETEIEASANVDKKQKVPASVSLVDKAIAKIDRGSRLETAIEEEIQVVWNVN